MSEENAGDSEVFEVEKIRELIELMKEYDLSEIDLRHSPRRIRLRRGPKEVASMVPMQSMPAPAASVPAQPPAAESVEDENATYIKSPMVGTFYSKPKPGADNFVKVGDSVSPETIVCLVEAMKMFNEVPAGVSGKIVQVMVENEDAVDVNKPLFKVAPN